MIHINGGRKPTPQYSFNEKLSENLFKRTHEDGLKQLEEWYKTNNLEEKFGIKNEPKTI